MDVSDLAERLGKKYGGWMEAATSAARVGGTWYAVPDYFVSIPVLFARNVAAAKEFIESVADRQKEAMTASRGDFAVRPAAGCLVCRRPERVHLSAIRSRDSSLNVADRAGVLRAPRATR